MDYREEAIECVKDRVLPVHQRIYARFSGDFDRIYSERYYSFFRSLNLTVGSMSGLRIRYSEEVNDVLSG